MDFYERANRFIWGGFLYSGVVIFFAALLHVVMISAMSQAEFMGWIEGLMMWWLLPFLVLCALCEWVQGVRLVNLHEQYRSGRMRLWRSFALQLTVALVVYGLFF